MNNNPPSRSYQYRRKRKRNGTIKARGIVVLDYDIEGGFKEAAEEQERLEQAIAEIVKGNKRVVFHQVDMKEHAGDTPPDITKMKFRTN